MHMHLAFGEYKYKIQLIIMKKYVYIKPSLLSYLTN